MANKMNDIVIFDDKLEKLVCKAHNIDAEEYPETDGVSLTMWAEAGEGDEPGCFRQFWYSADYQE